jgi:hypothetical protein
LIRKAAWLLANAAAAPRDAARTATAPAAPATPAATATAATTSAAATASTATTPGHLNAAANVFLVEDVERGKAHIGDFFIAKCDLMAKAHRRRLRRIRSRHSRRGCTAHHRKCQTGCPQHRNGFRHVLFLRRLFYTLHSRNLHTCNWSDSSNSNLARDKSPRKAIAHFALNSPLLTGIWFILMNEFFIFVHRLFINVGGLSLRRKVSFQPCDIYRFTRLRNNL